MDKESRLEINKLVYSIPLIGWILYIVFSDSPVNGWLVLVLLCFSLFAFYLCFYYGRIELLQRVFSGFKVSSFIVGIFITYGAVTGSVTFFHAMKLILYYILPLIILSLIICDLGNFTEASLCLLASTVPFGFMANIIGLKRGRVVLLQKSMQINFWPNFFNNLICSFCIMGGLAVTVEYVYKEFSPTFGFIGFSVFIYIMIPSFLFITILNYFAVTKKFRLFESSLIVLQSVISGLFIVYFIYILTGKSIFSERYT